jgi:hypothetical protein
MLVPERATIAEQPCRSMKSFSLGTFAMIFRFPSDMISSL